MKNLVFYNEKYINTIILKNCQSTLATIYLKKYFNYDYKDHNSCINGDNSEEYNFLLKNCIHNESYIDKLQNEGYKKFIVYRDPFDRFLSLYKDMKISDYNHLYEVSLGLNNKLSDEEYLKKYLELKNANLDDHITPQYKFYRNVDFIVLDKDLNKFIINELKFEPIIKNSSKSLDISKYENMFKFKDIIYENYKEDLELINKYKIYK